jgi:ribosomal protein L40E
MPRATCRCGQALAIPADPTERVVCPGCGARVRIRQKPATAKVGAEIPADGYIRFFCECGRRLKVDAASPPPFGKCPDCGAVVPVPATSLTTARPPGHPESPTEELAASDRAAVEKWSTSHRARAAASVAPPPPEPEPGTLPTMAFSLPPSDRVEVGMRICAHCGQPIHLGAENCRNCGTAVPKR